VHELGVVFHCVKEINKIAAENHVRRVNSVTIQLGEVSTVIPAYFEDCWNWAVKKETVLKDAPVHIEIIPAITFCEDCRQEYPTVKHGKICPHCGSAHTYLLQGNEFMIKELEAVSDTSPDPAEENQ